MIIEDILKNLIGQVCWNIHFKQVNLSFEIGKPQLKIETCEEDPVRDRQLRKYTRVKGQWFFWVYCAYWKLTVYDVSGKHKLLASTSISDKKKRAVCSLLCGQKITHIEINSETWETKLLFDLGAELVIRRPNQKAEKMWLLYDIDNCCYSFNGNGTYDLSYSSDTNAHTRTEIGKSIFTGIRLSERTQRKPNCD